MKNILIGAQVFCWPKIINQLGPKPPLKPPLWGGFDPLLEKFYFAGMWTTRTIADSDNRELFVRTTIRELVVYLIFLVVFCVCKYLQMFSNK